MSTFHVIVPIVYWGFLSSAWDSKSPFSKWTEVSFHGLDAGLSFIEFIFTRMFLFWSHIGVFLVVLLFYMVMTWVHYAT
jgi:hypothetical protein